MEKASMKSIRRNAIPFSFGILLIFSMQSTAVSGKRTPWQTPQSVLRILPLLQNDFSPTLSAPRLLLEPEYTIGIRNILYWPSDSIETASASTGWNLLFYEIQAQFSSQDSTMTLWGYVEAGQDSAVFIGLPEGIPIEYRLRYYARTGSSQFGLSHWSEAQVSIQDAHPPVLEAAEIVGLQRGSAVRWVTGRNLAVRVRANDAPAGKVMELAVREQSAFVDDTVFFDIVPPKSGVDSVFSPVILKTAEHIQVTLTFWVIDVSGQTSEPVVSPSLFWMPDEETRMFCFPNPFNPSKNEISVIKVRIPEANTAKIFDPFGNAVRILHKKDPSDTFFEWDGRNQRGDVVANGGYLCVVEGQEKKYCKIAVLR
jgi:hypothetical protein